MSLNSVPIFKWLVTGLDLKMSGCTRWCTSDVWGYAPTKHRTFQHCTRASANHIKSTTHGSAIGEQTTHHHPVFLGWNVLNKWNHRLPVIDCTQTDLLTYYSEHTQCISSASSLWQLNAIDIHSRVEKSQAGPWVTGAPDSSKQHSTNFWWN